MSIIRATGIDNESQPIANVADPVNPQDVATKAFSSNADNLTVGTLDKARLSLLSGKVLGRSSAGVGAAEDLNLDASLALTAGTLKATDYLQYSPPFSSGVSRTIKLKFAETISLADFGAVNGTDCTTALQNAYAELPSGYRLLIPSGTFYTTSALTFGGTKKLALVGSGSRQSQLVYAGSNTTVDCFTFGDGVNELNSWSFEGIGFNSDTTMTAGTGVRFKNIVRASLRDVTFGHQDAAIKFYNGVWFDGADVVFMSDFQCRAFNDGLRVSGGIGKPKAGLYLNNGRIMNCEVGLHIGGDFGGFYMDSSDIIANATNVLIDQALVAVNNREAFFGPGVSIDTADLTKTATQFNGVGLDIQDTAGFVFLNGTWVASAGTLIRTGPSFNGELNIDGGLLFNAFSSYGGNGNGIEINSPSTLVNISSRFRNIQGTAVTCSSVTNNVKLRGVTFGSDVTNQLFNIGVSGGYDSAEHTPFGGLVEKGASLEPFADNTQSLGSASARFSDVWSVNGVLQTSDRRHKRNIAACSLGLDFINKLNPVSYQWEPASSSQTIRTNWGFIAQDVKEVYPEFDVDFGGWVQCIDGSQTQALRYDQFLAPLTKAVQELSAKVNQLEAEINNLKKES